MYCTRLMLIFLVICLYKKVKGEADVRLLCPKTFKDNDVNTITLEINSRQAVADARCVSGEVTKVVFERQRVGDQTGSTLCYTSYACEDANEVPPPTKEQPKPQCGCVQISDDKLTFQLKLFANKTRDAKAKFSYQMCAAPKNPFTTEISESCKSISFPDPDSLEGGCNHLCIGLIVGGGILVVAIVIGIVFYVRNKTDGHGPVPTEEV